MAYDALQKLRKAEVLVLGGSGVIGSRLVEFLVETCEASVSVLVRNLSKAVRIARFPVTLIHGDVTDKELLDKAMAGKSIVIDCTFPKEGEFKERCENARIMANTIGEAVLRHGVKRLVHLSTISVYGRPSGDTLDENAPRRPGNDAYGASKLAGEQEMVRLFKEKNLPVVVLQPTIVYGPFAGWTVGPIAQLQNGTFVLPDNGEGACNAVYLDDVVMSILRAAVAPDVEGEIFLISGEEVVTWRSFYGAYESMLGFASTKSMTELEIANELKKQAHNARPSRRLLKKLREDAELRQIVLGLPGLAQLVSLVKALSSTNRMEKIKDSLLDRKNLQNSAKSKPLLFPTEVQLGVYAPKTKVSIKKAQRLLGYSPGCDLKLGMERTRGWADWARLLS